MLRRHEQEAEQTADELEQFHAWSVMLAGPPPANDAPVEVHLAYIEALEKAERDLGKTPGEDRGDQQG